MDGVLLKYGKKEFLYCAGTIIDVALIITIVV